MLLLWLSFGAELGRIFLLKTVFHCKGIHTSTAQRSVGTMPFLNQINFNKTFLLGPGKRELASCCWRVAWMWWGAGTGWEDSQLWVDTVSALIARLFITSEVLTCWLYPWKHTNTTSQGFLTLERACVQPRWYRAFPKMSGGQESPDLAWLYHRVVPSCSHPALRPRWSNPGSHTGHASGPGILHVNSSLLHPERCSTSSASPSSDPPVAANACPPLSLPFCGSKDTYPHDTHSTQKVPVSPPSPTAPQREPTLSPLRLFPGTPTRSLPAERQTKEQGSPEQGSQSHLPRHSPNWGHAHAKERGARKNPFPLA